MSLQLFVLDKLLRVTAKRRLRRNPDVMELRPMMAEFPTRAAPAHVLVDSVMLAGIKTERLRTAQANDSKALLYLHGGGFVAGTPANYRPITWRLAEQTDMPVYAIEYRLAPEHPFPAALEDCVAAYRALLGKGIAAKSIVIAGDSAGGNLTLTTALKLKELGVEQPAALVCLSPATDIEGFESRRSNVHNDALFVAEMMPTLAPLYCPAHDPKDPLVSPWRGDVTGLPPTLIQCASGELLRDDSVYMADKMKAEGVDVTLEIWPKTFHVWHLMADFLPEGRKAIANITRFIKAHLAQ